MVYFDFTNDTIDETYSDDLNWTGPILVSTESILEVAVHKQFQHAAWQVYYFFGIYTGAIGALGILGNSTVLLIFTRYL